MTKAEIIADIADRAAPGTAVIFNGAQPREIGALAYVASAEAVRPAVDAMLIAAGLSATYVSAVACLGRFVVIAHG